MYGPDPADVELRNSSAASSASAPGWSVPPFSMTTSLLTMPSVGVGMMRGSAGLGCSATRRTVEASTASAVTPSIRNEPLPLSSRTRLSEKATSAASTGEPSENTASSRSVNVNSVASSLASHDSARPGIGSVTSLFWNVSSVSYIAGMMIPPVVSNIRPGSIVTRSKLLPTTSVPPPSADDRADSLAVACPAPAMPTRTAANGTMSRRDLEPDICPPQVPRASERSHGQPGRPTSSGATAGRSRSSLERRADRRGARPFNTRSV